MFVAIPPRQRRRPSWVTPLLVIGMCAAFIWTVMLPVDERALLLQSRGMLGGGDLPLGGRGLRLLTASFLHADWTHLLGNLVFLMLCGRAPDAEGAPDREAMRQELYSQRLAAYGESYLAELRADAFIRYP